MSDDLPSPDALPQFWVSRRKRMYYVSFDPSWSSVTLNDEKGRSAGSVPVGARHPFGEGVKLESNSLRLGPTSYDVSDDQMPAAVAFVAALERFQDETARRDLAHIQRGDPLEQLTEPIGPQGDRFQYAVVGVGMFGTAERMAGVLAAAGEHGWELVTVYDKASNWFSGMEKGFMLMKRQIPIGVEVSQWCIVLRN